MDIGILGSNGFIASHLIEYLKEMHIEARGYRRGEIIGVHDILIHLAQPNRITNHLSTCKAEHLSLLNLLKSKCSHVIYISSASIYGNLTSGSVTENHKPAPTDEYGIFKYYCEQHVQNLFSKFTILRPSNVFGQGMSPQSIIGEYLKKRELGLPIQFKKAYPVRDFISIEDLVKGIYQIIDKNCQGIYNVSTGIGTSIHELISTMDNFFSLHSTFEIIKSELVDCLVLDPGKLIDDTAWIKPTSFTETFHKFLRTYGTNK